MKYWSIKMLCEVLEHKSIHYFIILSSHTQQPDAKLLKSEVLNSQNIKRIYNLCKECVCSVIVFIIVALRRFKVITHLSVTAACNTQTWPSSTHICNWYQCQPNQTKCMPDKFNTNTKAAKNLYLSVTTLGFSMIRCNLEHLLHLSSAPVSP